MEKIFFFFYKKHLIDTLEGSADRIRMSERYELMGEIYKIAIPLYEMERNFQLLAEAYGTLKDSYEKVVGVMETGRRMLGRYYRVAFYGRVKFFLLNIFFTSFCYNC